MLIMCKMGMMNWRHGLSRLYVGRGYYALACSEEPFPFLHTNISDVPSQQTISSKTRTFLIYTVRARLEPLILGHLAHTFSPFVTRPAT
jgi:hypothetical protein